MMQPYFSALSDSAKMPGDPEEEDENWFRPVWETEDEAALEPPGPARARRAAGAGFLASAAASPSPARKMP